jgi:hypothetical protein
MYRLFVDEVGHEDFGGCEIPEQRYLGLTGIVMNLAYEQGGFTARLNQLKRETFGREDMVLHRREILNRCPAPFDRLRDEQTRSTFDAACLKIYEESQYRALTVVIDKAEHKRVYTVWRFHPYHYCMTCLLERYALWMTRRGYRGDVMFESRGKKQNKRLAKSYQRIFRRGTENLRADVFQRCLTTGELKIQPKSANVAGLQLADLMASPLCRDLICNSLNESMKAGFGKAVVDIVRKTKYDRNPRNGEIKGWGTKWLPK